MSRVGYRSPCLRCSHPGRRILQCCLALRCASSHIMSIIYTISDFASPQNQFSPHSSSKVDSFCFSPTGLFDRLFLSLPPATLVSGASPIVAQQ